MQPLFSLSILALLISGCGPTTTTPDVKPAEVEAPSQSVDDVFGMFYAKTLEYALRNHHPGGKFSLALWDRKNHQLALPDRFLNKILAISNDLRMKYVPPSRLSHPPDQTDGRRNTAPLRDTLDGADVFLYSLSGMDWIAPSTVRVEYKRWRAPGDFMWQPVTFRQQGADWILIDEGLRLGDNYESKGTMKLIKTRVSPGPGRSVIQEYSK